MATLKKLLVDSKVFEFIREGNATLRITERRKVVKEIIIGSLSVGWVVKAMKDFILRTMGVL